MARIYSPFMATLYDQSEPVGYLGASTHYSVLRALTWQDVSGVPLPQASFQDFAVVWDEDHDLRVVPVIEALHALNLLSPVLFIGERKGSLGVVIDPAYPGSIEDYKEQVERVAQAQDDPWPAYVYEFGEDTAIIYDEADRVNLYLKSIHMLWQLGIKPRSSLPHDAVFSRPESATAEQLLHEVRAEAAAEHGGHFTLLGFTTHYKAAFGTPDLHGGPRGADGLSESYREVWELPGFETVEEALADLLRTKRSL